jgi:hypothetical protein
VSALGALVLAWNLAVFGAHALVPFRLASAEPEARRRWALLAPVALLSSVVVSVALLARSPDEGAAWGLGGPLGDSPLARVVALAVGALFAADVVVAIGWRRLEPIAWRVAGALGVVGAAAHAFGSELVRAGWGPAPGGLAALLALVVLRLPLAAVPVELALGRPRRFAPVAGPALALAVLLWPAAARAAMGRDLVTLAAAVLLLAAARWLPERLDRAAGWAGFALAVLFLARAAEVSRILGARESVPEILLRP